MKVPKPARDFVVGDRVTFGVLLNGLPTWNFDFRRGKAAETQQGVVIEVDSCGDFRVSFDNGAEWAWPQPSKIVSVLRASSGLGYWPEDADEDYVRLVVPDAAIPPAPAPEVALEITIPHDPKHEVPASVLASKSDEGERTIRRRLRIWPYGKRLARATSDPTGSALVITWTWVADVDTFAEGACA